MTGAPLVAAARRAAAAAGVPGVKKDDAKKESKEESKDDSSGDAEQVATNQAAEGKKTQQTPSDSKTTVAQVEAKEEIAVATAAKDRAETKQIGWAVESVSQNGRNVAQVALQMNTQVQVSVTQDMLNISNNFSTGRAQGSIIINQTFR
ncbi:MAG: hypothetical protein EBV10_10245 [Synechococcaceae bacterium WB6_1A_059]|nr:hypothetical protein [Synechococcaceae bacterium WB6_1A_059]